MADGVTVKVEGLKELAERLRSFGPKLARNGLRAAVSAAAQVIRKEAQDRVPVDTGLLRSEIYRKQIREQSSDTKQTYYVGVRKYKKKYANTKHNIRKGRITQSGKSLKTYETQDAFYWRFLEFGTPKMAARPFMRPAFESKKNEAVERMKEKLAERIKKIAGEK